MCYPFLFIQTCSFSVILDQTWLRATSLPTPSLKLALTPRPNPGEGRFVAHLSYLMVTCICIRISVVLLSQLSHLAVTVLLLPDLLQCPTPFLGPCTPENWLGVCKPIIEARMQKYVQMPLSQSTSLNSPVLHPITNVLDSHI